MRGTIIPHFGERPLNADDFLTLCTTFGIVIRSRTSADDGYFTYEDGAPTINLRFDLADAYRLWVGFHELGHFFLHPLDARVIRHSGWADALEDQANSFAAVALGLGPIERIDVDDTVLTVRTRGRRRRGQAVQFIRYS